MQNAYCPVNAFCIVLCAKMSCMKDPVDQGMADRLRRARREAGYGSAVEAWRARAHPVSEVTYLQHESGLRGFGKHAGRYAAAYRVREDWLRYGRGTPKALGTNVPVLGYIIQSGQIEERSDQKMAEGLPISAPIPPVTDAEVAGAYYVPGNENFPALFAGDIVYVGEFCHADECLGRQCVVIVTDGSQKFGILTKSDASARHYILTCANIPPEVVEVEHCSPVLWIKRGS